MVQSLLICPTLYCHLESIGLRGGSPYGATGLEGYTYRLPYVYVHANPIKEIRQGVKLPFDP